MQAETSSDYEQLDRKGTASVKLFLSNYREDIEAFVMTTADMDFTFSSKIRQAIMKRIETA